MKEQQVEKIRCILRVIDININRTVLLNEHRNGSLIKLRNIIKSKLRKKKIL